MKVKLLFLIIFITPNLAFSWDLGGALSLGYYNNPIEDSASSPIQQRPILFHNLNINYFNLRSGFGILEGYYFSNNEKFTCI